MGRKFNEENERIKRRYLQYLRNAERTDGIYTNYIIVGYDVG